MSQVKANLSNLNAADTLFLSRNVVTKMTGNSNFTTPVPGLAAITTGADGLEAAINAAIGARTASKLATQVVADKLKAQRLLLTQEASYVQTTTNGDKTKIESSGFEVRNTPAPIGSLPAPASLNISADVDPGTMALKWKSVKGAATYLVERAPDGPAPRSYNGIAAPTKAEANVNGMTSGARYWFRVAAVNAAGNGLFTPEQSKIAP